MSTGCPCAQGVEGVPDNHKYLRRIFSGFYERENGFRDACSTADILDCLRHAADDAPDMYHIMPRHAPDNASKRLLF